MAKAGAAVHTSIRRPTSTDQGNRGNRKSVIATAVERRQIESPFQSLFFSNKFQLLYIPMLQNSMGEEGPYRGVQ